MTKKQEVLVILLRCAVFALGTVMLAELTAGLIKGEIGYSIGEIDELTVTTSTWDHTLAVYLAFSPIMISLIILGAHPGLFLRWRWLWKALLGACLAGYVWTAVVGPSWR